MQVELRSEAERLAAARAREEEVKQAVASHRVDKI